MNLSGIMSKKIGPVPVVYIFAGLAAILAVVAWRMKPTEDGEDTLPPGAGGSEEGAGDGSPYDGLATTGTVVVQPATPVAETPTPDKPTTNEDWVREGAEWLVANKDASGPAAHSALMKFIEGRSRSVQEGQWVDAVIREKGFPPDPFQETPLPAPTPPPAPTPTQPPKPEGFRGYGWVQADGKTSGEQYAVRYKIPVSLFYTFNPNQPRVPRAGAWLKVRTNSNPLTGYTGK